MFLNYPKWTQYVTQIVNGGCHKPLLHLKLINTHAANFWNLVNSTRTAIWAVQLSYCGYTTYVVWPIFPELTNNYLLIYPGGIGT